MSDKFIYDIKYFQKVQSIYSKILDQIGFNTADPLLSNITHFNRTADTSDVEQPFIGKTFAFFTKPDLNLRQPDNFTKMPLFQYYYKTKMGKYLMASLQRPGHEMIDGEYIDVKYKTNTCFIPMLTNFCNQTSGGKDLILDTMETEGDYNGNKLLYARNANESYTVGEVTTSFTDAFGSPVLSLFLIWFYYIYGLCNDAVRSDWYYIINKIIDYTCSIYIIMTGRDQKTILRFAKYTGCFPKSVPFGQIQHSKSIDPKSLDNFDITWGYNRYEPMNPATIVDFNTISREFVYKLARPYCKKGRSFKYSDEQIENNDNLLEPEYEKNEYFADDGTLIDKEKNKAFPFAQYKLPTRLIKNPLDKDDPFFSSINTSIDPFNYLAGKDYKEKSKMSEEEKSRYISNYQEQELDHKWKGHPYIFGNKLDFI